MSHLSMPKEIQLHTCLPVENELGEGVVWDARQQCAFWTDILGSNSIAGTSMTTSLNTHALNDYVLLG